jgi:hypothetical protein
MSGKSKWPRGAQGRNPPRLDDPNCLKSLLAAGTRAASVGIALLDSQTRFESVNASLAKETRAPASN